MPEKFMFFDATPDDPREYPASQFAEYFSKFLTNGILNGGTNLQVSSAGTDMSVSIALGYAWIRGYLYSVYSNPISLEIPDADSVLNRIDRIVLRLDTTLANRYIKAFVVEGVPAAAPVPTALVRNDNTYEISLAQVLVVAGRSYIDGTQITDERLDTSVCGLVNSLIQADTTDIFNQFQAWLTTKTAEFEDAWDAWFDGQKAGSGTYALQADLTTLENTVGTIGTDLNTLDGDLDTHAAVVAGSTGLGHIKIGSDFYTGLEFADGNVLRIKHKPQIAFSYAEYTDSFTTVFNTTKKIYLSSTYLPYRMLTVIVKNKADAEKFLVYHVFPQYGYTYGVVWGRNSNNHVLALPYPGNGEDHGIVSSATEIGYGVAGTARIAITVRGIYTSSEGAPEFQINFAGVEAVSQSLNCRVEYFLS